MGAEARRGEAPALRADLPWYDHAQTSRALDDFWGHVRDALREAGCMGVPERRHTGADFARAWRDPRLLLSQCCGPDLDTEDGALLEPVARPVFQDMDAPDGDYFSHIVGALPKKAPLRVVINSPSSHSGHRALRTWMAERGLRPASVHVSGSHEASLQALRRGFADLAAIDAKSWQFLERRDVPVIGRTAPAPSPPWVTSRNAPVPPSLLRDALARGVDAAGAAIGIAGLLACDRGSYNVPKRGTERE